MKMNEPINVEEVSELIAIRHPPGDRWCLTNPEGELIDGIIHEGLVEAMSEYMRANDYHGDYRLAPLYKGGQLFIIKQVEIKIEKIEKPAPKKYDLYGEF